MKGFQKGKAKTGGKTKGTPNKLTKSVKECFESVFTKLQDNNTVKLEQWGKENPTEFYKLCAKLIPAAVDLGVIIKKGGLDKAQETYE